MRGKRSKVSEKLFTDNWPIRRRWLRVALIWMGLNIQYLLIWGNDDALHQNALIALISAVVALIGTYVFGAVWDDKDKRQYSEPPEVIVPPDNFAG